MENYVNFKELYDVSLKTTIPITINEHQIEAGETVAFFDRIQLGTFSERKEFDSARGGESNIPYIWWEESKDLSVVLTQGVFSLSQLSILTGSQMATEIEPFLLSARERVETDENGLATLGQIPTRCFCYDAQTGEKQNYTVDAQTIIGARPYQELIIDYEYFYAGGAKILQVGRPFTNGYLTLEGRTKIKDSVTGQITTSVIKIPKLKLMSDLILQLGKNGSPLMGTLRGTAYPDGPRGERKIMEQYFLGEEIDSDI